MIKKFVLFIKIGIVLINSSIIAQEKSEKNNFIEQTHSTLSTNFQTEKEKNLFLHQIKQTWTDKKDQFPFLYQQLKRADVIYHIPLKEYDSSVKDAHENKIVLMRLENAPLFIKGIFKPRGVKHRKAEQAAFEISQYLGMNGLIAPTISYILKETTAEGEINEIPGVISYYIDLENNEQQNFWKVKYGITQIQEQVSPESLNNFYAFARVFGMWDLKWNNTLMVGAHPPYSLMSLDNESLISNVYLPEKGHFFVCWKTDSGYLGSPYEDIKEFQPEILTVEEIPQAFDCLKRFFMNDDSIKKLETEEQRKEMILKRIKSFFWEKPSLPHYVGKKGWWLQLYKGHPSISPPKVSSLDASIIEKLQLLDTPLLKKIFQDLDDSQPIFLPQYYEAILMRRDSLFKELK